MSTALLTRRFARPAHLPVLDFLAPSIAVTYWQQPPCLARLHSTATGSIDHTTEGATIGTATGKAPDHNPNGGSATHTPPRRPPLTREQRDFLDSALRVNQAGELAAILIYASQTLPLTRAHPHLRPLMKHMYDQEHSHFTTFNNLIAKHRVRPTAMYPIWHFAASALGWGTAVLGREAAMACTEAVETEIGGHYNDQVRVLLEWVENAKARGEDLGEELTELVGTLRRIRDEELEHLDHAVDNDAKQAKPYELLTNVIRGGCRTAIWISERV